MRDFPRSLRVIDILAFQTLLREEDDVYLRRTLRRRSYRRVKRARIRAAHEYLLGIAENCLTIQVWVRQVADTKLSVSLSLKSMGRSAVRIRFTASAFWATLWIDWMLPSIHLGVGDLVETYCRFKEKAMFLSEKNKTFTEVPSGFVVA
jgi:hypothetical protein